MPYRTTIINVIYLEQMMQLQSQIVKQNEDTYIPIIHKLFVHPWSRGHFYSDYWSARQSLSRYPCPLGKSIYKLIYYETMHKNCIMFLLSGILHLISYTFWFNFQIYKHQCRNFTNTQVAIYLYLDHWEFGFPCPELHVGPLI